MQELHIPARAVRARYTAGMRDAREIVDEQFLQMRALCLRLAADLDRIQRGGGGDEIVACDARVGLLRQALGIVASPEAGRAARLETLLSDK